MTTSAPRPVALITGGTTGIGAATAQLLHDRGFDVAVTGLNPDTLSEARRTLPDGVLVLRADARVPADTAAVAERVRDRFGTLDAVFLNAGIGVMSPIEAVDEAQFDDLFAVNVKGQYFMLQAVLPLMRDGGAVVLNGALGAIHGIPNWSVVSATKAALMGMVPSLAVELAPRRIRVNAVVPGPIHTPAFGKLGLEPGATDEFAEFLKTRVPLGRMGSGADVAQAVAFLVSSAADFITGTFLTVDGGMSTAA